MVATEIYPRDQRPIAMCSFQVMLHYKSALYQTLETLFRLPSLLLSTDEQKQTVTVEFFNNYVENPVQQPSVTDINEICNILCKCTSLLHILFTLVNFLPKNLN